MPTKECAEINNEQTLQALLPIALAEADRVCADKPECAEWAVKARILSPFSDLEY